MKLKKLWSQSMLWICLAIKINNLSSLQANRKKMKSSRVSWDWKISSRSTSVKSMQCSKKWSKKLRKIQVKVNLEIVASLKWRKLNCKSARTRNDMTSLLRSLKLPKGSKLKRREKRTWRKSTRSRLKPKKFELEFRKLGQICSW